MGVLLGVYLPRRTKASVVESYEPPELPASSPWHGDEEIRLFREYLRIPTVHPDIDYGEK